MTRFYTTLTRGLMELVTSDAHQGLKNAIAAVFTGAAGRCTHFMANLLTRVPKRALLSLSRGLAWPPTFSHGTPSTSNCQVHGQSWNNSGSPPQVAELLADAAPDILAFRPNRE